MKTFVVLLIIVALVAGYVAFGDRLPSLAISNDTSTEQTVDRSSAENTQPPALTRINQNIQLQPISHASFVMRLGNELIFNDPVGDPSAYTIYGEPDLVLLSDTHGDHFSNDTLAAVVGANTTIIAPQAVADEIDDSLQSQVGVLENGQMTLTTMGIEAIPMYNLPEQGIEIRHEKGRGNGYLLRYDREVIYIAGDTADIPEMRALEGVTLAFVPMNLPYTMSVEDAADAVIEFAPDRVTPYHYRTPDGLSDVDTFKTLVESASPNTDVHLLDWYPETTTVVED